MGAQPYGLFSHGACPAQRARDQAGGMTKLDRHHHAEARFLDLLAESGFPPPDEVAHLRRCLIFLWEPSKFVVLIDLDELAPGDDPFDGFDPGLLLPGDGFAAAG
jgi:hypothetical protein